MARKAVSPEPVAVVHPDDAGVLEPGQGARFLKEAGNALRVSRRIGDKSLRATAWPICSWTAAKTWPMPPLPSR